MTCYDPLQGFLNPKNGGIIFKPTPQATQPMEVACGQCIGCRLDYSRMWSMRIVHEASLYEHNNGNSFITLTYRDQDACTDEQLKNGYHIPEDWGLQKAHFQKFMKRLRKANPGKRIPYYHCGEYSDTCRHGKDISHCIHCTIGRPHYHAIIFNHTFEDTQPCGYRNDTTYYTSPTLEKVWKHGFVQVGDVTLESAAYVARYCMKKITGEEKDQHYQNLDDYGERVPVQPEYATMSRKPGIGKKWYERFKSDLYPNDEVPVPGQGVFKKVPRYYDIQLERENPQLMEELKNKRKKFIESNPSEFTSNRLSQKHAVKKAQIKHLKRTLDK